MPPKGLSGDEPRLLVDRSSSLIEGRHVESEGLWTRALPGEIEAGLHEGQAQPMAGEIGAQTQTDLDHLPRACGELEETGKLLVPEF